MPRASSVRHNYLSEILKLRCNYPSVDWYISSYLERTSACEPCLLGISVGDKTFGSADSLFSDVTCILDMLISPFFKARLFADSII